MASLTTPLSVRLSEDDTSFLSKLEIDGAVTASDKIRGLIRQARQRAEPLDSFPAALAVSHDHMAATVRAVRVDAGEPILGIGERRALRVGGSFFDLSVDASFCNLPVKVFYNVLMGLI